MHEHGLGEFLGSKLTRTVLIFSIVGTVLIRLFPRHLSSWRQLIFNKGTLRLCNMITHRSCPLLKLF